MTAVKSGLMIIDQHRADIRIRYEQILERLNHHSASIQKVLFPEVIELSPSERVLMQTIMPLMADMGFDISDLGGGSYAINGVPSGSEGTDPVMLVRHIIADVEAQRQTNGKEWQSALALSLARHAAIPEGQVLNNEEMEQVVNALFACSNVNYTPDGRTILTILPQSDIEHLLDSK